MERLAFVGVRVCNVILDYDFLASYTADPVMNILIVDDDPTALSLLEWQLGEELGHRIVTRTSVEDAILLLAGNHEKLDEPFDVVITGYRFHDVFFRPAAFDGHDLIEFIMETGVPVREVVLYSGLRRFDPEVLALQRKYGARFRFFERGEFSLLRRFLSDKPAVSAEIVPLRTDLVIQETSIRRDTEHQPIGLHA